MKIKLDENLPSRVASLLNGMGHDVHTVFDEGLAGTVQIGSRLRHLDCLRGFGGPRSVGDGRRDGSG